MGHASTAIEAKLVSEILRIPMIITGPGVLEGERIPFLTDPLEPTDKAFNVLRLAVLGAILQRYVPFSLGPEIAGALLDEAFADGTFASAKKGANALERPNAEKVRSGWWWSMAKESLSVLISIRPRRVK